MLRKLLVVLAAALLLAVPVATATAAPTEIVCPEGKVLIRGTCRVSVTAPGIPGSTPVITKDPECYYQGKKIDCEYDGGRWSPTRNCYTKKANPQPPLDDPLWEGRTNGVIISCTYMPCVGVVIEEGAAGMCFPKKMWAPFVPGSPEELAHVAVAEMGLAAPEIGLTGYGRPDSMQLLGLPTWMWAADPGESTTGPIARTVSAGGVTVTATARVRETVWHMGDGGSVTCSGDNAAGTPYADSYDGRPSPTCGYQYTRSSARQPGGAYTVLVTANWEVQWSGGGESGTITTSFGRQTQLRVGENQVIVNGSGQGEP